MLQLRFKDSDVIAIVTEDDKPYACGFKKDEDVFFAIEISIYKNNSGRRGRLLSRYSYMWEEPTDDDTIYSFISNILKDPTYRKDFLHTSNNWLGSIVIDFDNMKDRVKIIDNNSPSIKSKKKVKHFSLPNNEYIDSNISLKLDVLSLLISDSDIRQIKLEFKDRPSILFAMKLVIQGEALKDAIEKTKNTIKSLA